MMKRIIGLACLIMMLLPCTSEAQILGSNISVTIVPDHKDWTYQTGEKIVFTVSVLKSGTLLDHARISYEMGPEMYPNVKDSTTIKTGTTRITGKMSTPGFYRLKVTAHVGGKDYSAWCAVAVSPQKIRPTTLCPPDFDTFWDMTLKAARQIPLEPTMEYLPDRSSPDVNTYQVSFQNDRWGRRVYGILNVPAKPGRYPALLRVPGAGVRPYTGDQWMAQQGIIVLEIGIHGIPVTREQAYYDQLFSAALSDYWLHGVHSRETNYYRHVITGCVRAIDFIASLSGHAALSGSMALQSAWDGQHLAVTGSSQGGFLTLATTALDKRVSCYGAVHAAMCDHEAALKQVACGWPHYYYNEQTQRPLEHVNPLLVKQTRYYDGVNFARRITVPGYYSFGYNDPVVPPTTAYATFNIAGGDKTLSPYQQTAHFWYQEQWDEWQAYLIHQLKTNP